METKIIPKNFIDVIFSFKKITPPMRANTGVRAPKAAVWGAPSCWTAKFYSNIATMAIKIPWRKIIEMMSKFEALAKVTWPKIIKVGTAITDPQKSPNTKPINGLTPLFLK